MELTGPNVLDQSLFQDSRNLVASMVERSSGGLSLASSILFSHAASNSTYSRALLYASVRLRGVCFFLVGMIVSLRQSLFIICAPSSMAHRKWPPSQPPPPCARSI